MKIKISTNALDKQKGRISKAEIKVQKLKVELAKAKVALAEEKAKLKDMARSAVKPVNKPVATNRPSPKPTTSAPKPSSTQRKPSDINLRDYKSFDPATMKGKKWYDALNEGFAFPKMKEGFWRAKFKPKRGDIFPFPVKMSVAGYNRKSFVAQLEETESKLRGHPFSGMSPHRWTGKNNGISEFRYKGWKWPQGYITYIRQGVPPSREFYKVITGEDNANLPTYGR